jgi:hypothetical protein
MPIPAGDRCRFSRIGLVPSLGIVPVGTDPSGLGCAEEGQRDLHACARRRAAGRTEATSSSSSGAIWVTPSGSGVRHCTFITLTTRRGTSLRASRSSQVGEEGFEAARGSAVRASAGNPQAYRNMAWTARTLPARDDAEDPGSRAGPARARSQRTPQFSRPRL